MVQAPLDLPMLELLHLRLREHPGRLSGEINLLKGLLTPWTDRLQHGEDFVERNKNSKRRKTWSIIHSLSMSVIV